MLSRKGRGKGRPLPMICLLVFTGNKWPLIGGTKPGPTTLLSIGTDKLGTFELWLRRGRVDQHMVGPVEGSSFFPFISTEETETHSGEVPYDDQSTHHSSSLLFHY
jgi:hypothetical protein